MQLHHKEKAPAQLFSCKLFETFKKTDFVEHVRTNAWVKWTKKIVFSKATHRKAAVMASFLGQLQTGWLTVFPKRTLWCFSMKIAEFREHYFYRTLLRDCLWFPVTISMYHLLYHWSISSAIASCLGLSENKSVCTENI